MCSEQVLCRAEHVSGAERHGGGGGAPGDFPNLGISVSSKKKSTLTVLGDTIHSLAMGKATKATRKFASSGQLKKTIQSRKKHQQIKKKIEGRRGAKGKGKDKAPVRDDGSEQDNPEEDEKTEFVHGCYGAVVC